MGSGYARTTIMGKGQRRRRSPFIVRSTRKDSSLPHQIKLTVVFSQNAICGVGCNCRGDGHPFGIVHPGDPSDQAMRLYDAGEHRDLSAEFGAAGVFRPGSRSPQVGLVEVPKELG